ncbi:MAG: helix-turn-helix transcriptional regulator [Gammaproteobacteria bacterium]|nr:helix-turn-helix transcriptional regulator [Gammaproteobacteria bacterium]
MVDLLNIVKNTINPQCEQPFSVYSSITQQNLLNVPIVKPLLIVVLSGNKELGKDHEINCASGNFIFLADNPAINMRNIPKDKEYYALLIEFDYQDFQGLQVNTGNQKRYYVGEINQTLSKCLQQFVEISLWAPKPLWSLRKREIIELLCHLGHQEILSMVGTSNVTHRLHQMFCEQSFEQLTVEYICDKLAMSESTLRRKLKHEGTSVQEIKDQARLGLGLHLLQTTYYAIGLIAQKCGYQSQSRFADRFKGRFGLTPSELRKTKMAD